MIISSVVDYKQYFLARNIALPYYVYALGGDHYLWAVMFVKSRKASLPIGEGVHESLA